MVLVLTSAAQFMVVLDVAVVNVALPVFRINVPIGVLLIAMVSTAQSPSMRRPNALRRVPWR
jgi:hypothetical protein